MQILVTNLVPTGQLSLELVFEGGPGPSARIVRSTLRPGGSVDIGNVCTLSEANMNTTLQNLIASGSVSVSVVEQARDNLSPESQFNKLRNDVATAWAQVLTVFHKNNPNSIGLVTSPDAAVTLATVLTLANELRAKIVLHLASAGDTGAHRAASATSITAPAASDQGTANTLLNELKADYNTHLAEAGVHIKNDGTNTIAAADASNLGTSITLANELKADFNLHKASAMDSLPMGNS